MDGINIVLIVNQPNSKLYLGYEESMDVFGGFGPMIFDKLHLTYWWWRW